MITPLIVAFRESFEAFLIVIPLLVYIYKADRKDLSKYIYSGCIFGVATGLTTGAIIIMQVNKLEGYPQELFSGLMMLFLAALIFYSIILVNNSNINVTLDISEKYDIKFNSLSLFILPFITIFRESLEIIIFTIPLLEFNHNIIIASISIGILLSLTLSYIVFKTTHKLNISKIFNILMIVFIFIGADLFGEGIELIFPKANELIIILAQGFFIIPCIYIFFKKVLKKYFKR